MEKLIKKILFAALAVLMAVSCACAPKTSGEVSQALTTEASAPTAEPDPAGTPAPTPEQTAALSPEPTPEQTAEPLPTEPEGPRVIAESDYIEELAWEAAEIINRIYGLGFTEDDVRVIVVQSASEKQADAEFYEESGCILRTEFRIYEDNEWRLSPGESYLMQTVGDGDFPESLESDSDFMNAYTLNGGSSQGKTSQPAEERNVESEGEGLISAAWKWVEDLDRIYGMDLTEKDAMVTIEQYKGEKSAFAYFYNGSGWNVHINFEYGEDSGWELLDRRIRIAGSGYPDEERAQRDSAYVNSYKSEEGFTGEVTAEQLEAAGFTPTKEGAEQYAGELIAALFVDCPNSLHCSDAHALVPEPEEGGGDTVILLLLPEDIRLFAQAYVWIGGDGYYAGGPSGGYRGYYRIILGVTVLQNGNTFSFTVKR